MRQNRRGRWSEVHWSPWVRVRERCEVAGWNLGGSAGTRSNVGKDAILCDCYCEGHRSWDGANGVFR